VIRCTGQGGLGFAYGYGHPFADRPANVIDVLIVQDGEQPSPQVGAFLPQVLLGNGAHQAILDEIVGGDLITGQRPRIAPQAGDNGFDAACEIAHH
jgi:hypothetical protein